MVMSTVVWIIFILLFGIIIVQALIIFKNFFYFILYMDRYKRACFIDLRKSVNVILHKDRSGFDFRGNFYVWNSEFEKAGAINYDSRLVEPIKVQKDETQKYKNLKNPVIVEPNLAKFEYFCLTQEYNIVFRNKLLEYLMLFNKSTLIGIILILCIIIFAGLVYILITMWDIQNGMNNIQEFIKNTAPVITDTAKKGLQKN